MCLDSCCSTSPPCMSLQTSVRCLQPVLSCNHPVSPFTTSCYLTDRGKNPPCLWEAIVVSSPAFTLLQAVISQIFVFPLTVCSSFSYQPPTVPALEEESFVAADVCFFSQTHLKTS
ncbi:hypothetical protein ILYODFUR_037855 [Ilyodon furcidens]|uniref:Uncharacterized protein n=1 Tax=Ilyodon furcidens TaxID=33524 RepID=A0ABV0VB89_9TELE